MAILSSFCGLLTLQVGVAVLAALYFLLAAVMLVANVFDLYTPWDWDWPINLVLMLLLVILFIAIAICAFASSYSENRRLALVAVVLIAIALLYWAILSCFSFFSSAAHSRAICIVTRCPESLWIANLGYKKHEYETFNEADYVRNTTTVRPKRESGFFHISWDEPLLRNPFAPPPLGNRFAQGETIRNIHKVKTETMKNAENAMKRQKRQVDVEGYTKLSSGDILYPKRYLQIVFYSIPNAVRFDLRSAAESLAETKNWKNMYMLNSDGKASMLFKFNGTVEEEPRIRYGWAFAGAVILFVANLLFFVFSILILLSWASELDWADYYIEDEPVVIYEEEG